MDIIGLAIFQLLFLSAFMAIMFFVVTRFQTKEKRPGIEQEPELLKYVKGVVGNLPGLNPDDKILGQDQGTFYATADISYVWERVVDDLKRFPINDNPKYCWRNVTNDQAYRRIILNAEWSEKQKMVGYGNMDSMTETSFHLFGILQFEQLEAGGTAIHFNYQFSRADLFGEKMKRATNNRLRNICLQLTQDPTRGSPF